MKLNPITDKLASKLFNLKYLNALCLILFVACIAVYYGIIIHFSVNIPLWDDYNLTFGFLQSFDAADSPAQQLQLLYQLANEHRLFWYRLLLLIERSLFGNVNFIRMAVFGSTGVFFIGILLWRIFQEDRLKILYFLPVVFLLFVPVWARSLWACSAFNNTYVWLFGFSALYFLNMKGWLNMGLAILCGILASYSFGNGIFVFPAGLFLLWIKGRSKKEYLIWIVAMLIIWASYFWGYTGGGEKPTSYLFTNPILFGVYICAFFGEIFRYLTPYIAPFAGFVFLLSVLGLFLFHYSHRKRDALIWSFLSFLLLTVLAAAISRSGLGLGQAISYRYELIPTLGLILLYFFCLKVFRKDLVFTIALLMSLVLYVARMDENIKESYYLKERLEDGLLIHYAGDHSALSAPTSIQKRVSTRMKEFENKGMYQSPIAQLLNTGEAQVLDNLPDSGPPVISKLYIHKNTRKLIFLKGWAYIKGMQTHRLKIKLYLKATNEKVYIFETTAVPFRYLTQHYGYGQYLDKSGFKFVLDKLNSDIPKGEYEMGLILYNDKEVAVKKIQDMEL